MGVKTLGSDSGAPSRQRATGVRGRSLRALGNFFTAFFLKNTVRILGKFWPKFLLTNSFFKCLNKVWWYASKARAPRCMPLLTPFLCL